MTTDTAMRTSWAASNATTVHLSVHDADVSIRHEATDTATLVVSASDRVDFDLVDVAVGGDDITIRVPPLLSDAPGRRGIALDLGFFSMSLGDARARVQVDIVVPEKASLDIETRSGEVLVAGASGSVRVRSGTGDVTLDEADSAVVTTASGDIMMGRVFGEATVRSGSGNVRLRHALGNVDAVAASGDIDLLLAEGQNVTARAASGDVLLVLPAGVPVWQDIHTSAGEVVSHLAPVGQPAEGERFVTVRITTASGDITLRNP